jgi:hypothetical protein
MLTRAGWTHSGHLPGSTVKITAKFLADQGHATSAIMHKWKFIPLLATILSGCAQQRQLPSDLRLAAWDGLGRSPNLAKPDPKLRVRHPGPGVEDLLERQKVLETLCLYSSSWWVVHDEIEAARLCRNVSIR